MKGHTKMWKLQLPSFPLCIRIPLLVHHHTKLFVAQLVVLQQDIFFFLSCNRTFVCFCLFFPAIGHFLPGIFCPATGNIFLFWICLTSSRKTLCSLLSYNRKYRSSKDSLENSVLQQKRSNLPCFGQILWMWRQPQVCWDGDQFAGIMNKKCIFIRKDFTARRRYMMRWCTTTYLWGNHQFLFGNVTIRVDVKRLPTTIFLTNIIPSSFYKSVGNIGEI